MKLLINGILAIMFLVTELSADVVSSINAGFNKKNPEISFAIEKGLGVIDPEVFDLSPIIRAQGFIDKENNFEAGIEIEILLSEITSELQYFLIGGVSTDNGIPNSKLGFGAYYSNFRVSIAPKISAGYLNAEIKAEYRFGSEKNYAYNIRIYADRDKSIVSIGVRF